MKRFIGLVLTVAGGIATLWGGFYVLSGQSSAQITIADTFAVNAMIGGLVGLAVLTIGLVWMRD